MAVKSVNFEAVSSFQKEAMDALVEAATASGKGFEKFQAELMAYAKTSGEAFNAATKAIFGAKSLDAAIEAQSAYARSAFEAHMSELAKLGGIVSESLKAAMEPLAAQTKALAGKMVPPAA